MANFLRKPEKGLIKDKSIYSKKKIIIKLLRNLCRHCSCLPLRKYFFKLHFFSIFKISFLTHKKQF